MLEKTIETAVCRWWRELPYGQLPARKLNGEGFRGWPDRLFPIPGGRPFLIEFKRPGGKLTPLQALTIEQLKQQGYDVEVHDDKQTAITALRARLEAARLSEGGGEVSD